MRANIFILCVLVLITSCKEGPDYKEAFKDNEQLFNSTIAYLEHNYIFKKEVNNKLRLIFYNCEKGQPRLESDICDDTLSAFMIQLKIREIALEKEGCEDSNDSFPYSMVYFMIEKDDYYPVCYYVYDYCGKWYAYESKTIYQVTILDNWSFLKDSSFP